LTGEGGKWRFDDRDGLSRKERAMAKKFKKEFFKDAEILFGVFYPTRYIIAVFENADQAEQAVAAVTQAGYEARHATPQQALERAEAFLHQRSPAQRVEGAISSDEKDAMQEYIALAKKGQHLVDVYVPQEPEVAQVEAILEAHGASHIHYYGAWDVEDLSTNEPTR
jgi:hypothetical protein